MKINISRKDLINAKGDINILNIVTEIEQIQLLETITNQFIINTYKEKGGNK
jgi:hypothetical protein